MGNDVYQRAGVAVIVGIITGVVLAFVGMLVGKYLDADIGSFIAGVSWLVGILAAVYYFLTSRRLV